MDDGWHQAKIPAVSEVEKDLIGDFDRISELIDATRSKIESHRNSKDNMQGCLTGTVDDYLVSFEGQVKKFKA